jgi:uncharacterized MAPEG superfamily protein
MQSLMTDPALKTFALAGTVVALQLVLLALWTGTVRAMRKVWVNPEDAKLNKGEQADADHPDVLRVKRAHQNALENAIPFFAIGLLYALTNPSVGTAQAYFFTFMGARLLHSVFYLWGKQPFRTMMFALGVLCMIGMGVQVLRAAM